MLKIAILLMISVVVCLGQTTVNGGRDFKGVVRASGSAASVDFSGAGGTAPVAVGTLAARPAGCSVGQVYFATDATAGLNLSFCTSSGVWSAMTGSGGGSSSGPGVSYCAPSGGSGSAYACSPSPAVTAYAAGVTLAFVPDVSGAGGATTVNVNGLGTKAVKQADGSTNPASTDIAAGKVLVLSYDGAVFRMVPAPTVTSVAGRTGAVTLTASDVGLGNVTNVNTASATNISSGTLADARLTSNVPLKNAGNAYTGYNDFSGGRQRLPEATFASAPGSPVTGQVFLFTDASAAGTCTGGGAAFAQCRWSGSAWQAVGGGSGGGGGLADPGSNGIVKRTGAGTSAVAAAADVVGLFSSCSGTAYLGADGICHTPSNSSVVFYSGLCQAAVPSFPFSTPSANAPLPACVNSGTAVTAVEQWANNTSNQSVQQQFVVPPSWVSGGTVTVKVWFRSTDSTHATPATLSYAVVAGWATIDNPTFTSAGAVNMTGSGSNQATAGTISFSLTANAGDILDWKLVADTTALTGGATWDLISIRFLM